MRRGPTIELKGGVERWRGDARRSVSTSRSSNRTCGSPASGSRRRFMLSHAAGGRGPISAQAGQTSAPASDSSSNARPDERSCVWQSTTCGTDNGRGAFSSDFHTTFTGYYSFNWSCQFNFTWNGNAWVNNGSQAVIGAETNTQNGSSSGTTVGPIWNVSIENETGTQLVFEE
jgi:hypothetical protein